jgi:hypothetical protein
MKDHEIRQRINQYENQALALIGMASLSDKVLLQEAANYAVLATFLRERVKRAGKLEQE